MYIYEVAATLELALHVGQWPINLRENICIIGGYSIQSSI